jgi:hypothetical protein
MSRSIMVLAFLILIAASLMIIFVAFNLLYPYPTMIVESPAKVLNPIVRQGEALQVQINCEKFTDRPGLVIRQFINDIIYVMPSYVSNYGIGKSNRVSLSTKIPTELPPGEYYVKTTIEYEFPPFRNITYSFDTEMFTVVKQ